MTPFEEVSAMADELPGHTVTTFGENTLLAAGYPTRYPRALLTGPGVKLHHQVRFMRLARDVATESVRDRLAIERGPGTLKRCGYRRYIYALGGTMTLLDWLAIVQRVHEMELNNPGSCPDAVKFKLAHRLADAIRRET